MNRLTTTDIEDLDIVDASELASDGYTSYKSVALTSTTAGTKRVIINAITYEDYLDSIDLPVEIGDIVVITGVAAGDYRIADIISNIEFEVEEDILSSAAGTVTFMHPSGASRIGVDNTGFNNTVASNLQDVLADFDANIVGETGHAALRQLIHLANGGPYEGFASGAYREVLPAANPFPTQVIWWEDSGKTQKIVEKNITRNSNKTPATIEWKAYDVNGVTVLATVTDTITYSGIFELSRTRTIT